MRVGALHPFTVLTVAAAVITTTVALGQPWVSAAVIVACGVLAGRAGRLRPLALAAGAVVLPAWGSQLLIHGVATPGPHVLVDIGPLHVNAEGLTVAGQLGLRLAVVVVVGVTAALFIDRHDLIAAVDSSPAPPQLGYLAAATLSAVPAFRARARAIDEAQALRGVVPRRGPAGWWDRLRARAVPLASASVQDAVARAPHLAARGFPPRQRITRLRRVRDSVAQRRARVIALTVAAFGPALILGGPSVLTLLSGAGVLGGAP
ncbi:energy-coupling factor transporter transmembrane component T family protein [Zhihengliuella flava]|uniref:Energy-coupling factor transport system permease protein n=1 Tax=Zhihengliuella flava TaxID=1285193 RepID=A0A931GMS1_9MICC|nr:energy-coupling factor transporter transmembrane component T [Zhihengliuella flava]MBG6085699.1 energy-coupling factor transport system permease protein [Zhihengliuella flava]